MNNKTRTPLFHVAKRAALPWYKSWAIRGAALLLALILCGTTAALVLHNLLTGACMVFAAALVLWLVWRLAQREFGGMSGDLSGYFLQLAELIMLLCCVVISKVVVL